MTRTLFITVGEMILNNLRFYKTITCEGPPDSVSRLTLEEDEDYYSCDRLLTRPPFHVTLDSIKP